MCVCGKVELKMSVNVCAVTHIFTTHIYLPHTYLPHTHIYHTHMLKMSVNVCAVTLRTYKKTGKCVANVVCVSYLV